MKIVNMSKQVDLAVEVEVASSFWKRFMGLMGREQLLRGEALVIKPCNSIHTFFMRFPLDIVFLDADYRVVATATDVQPFRLGPVARGASMVLELPAGIISDTKTAVGDELKIVAEIK